MPSINNFQKSNKVKDSLKTVTTHKGQKSKRRPGREPEVETTIQTTVTKEEVHDMATTAPENHETHEAQATQVESEKSEAPRKIEISFPGSEILRAKLPRPFDVAEKVATDWVNDGTFEGLPLGHPLAQVLAAQGLKKAKEVEKKVIASGVVEKIAMQALTVGLKAQQEINNIRDQVKTRMSRK